LIVEIFYFFSFPIINFSFYLYTIKKEFKLQTEDVKIMPLFKRKDGTLLKNIPTFRRLNPYLMPTRTQSTIFIPLHVDVTETLKYCQELSEKRGEKVSIFNVLLTAFVRTFAMRPEINRFVSGTKIYQRKHIEFAFVVKKQFKDKAKETNIKMKFSPYETIFTVMNRVNREIKAARGKEYKSDKEVDSFGKLPGVILRILIAGFKFLDRHNMAPYSMIKTDPMYVSAFITNMGSVGMELGPHHHLFEWGNASLFFAISAYTKRAVVNDKNEVVVRDVLDLIVTWDDRIADGFYGQKSAEIMKDFVENPKQLEEPPEITEKILDELMLDDISLIEDEEE
jgi:2-oxoacid dehydrogenases acyltransferase (catalytic domain)